MSVLVQDGKIGFIAGAFDLGPHAGHMMMLKECADNCDYLIVGLHIDPSIERKEKNKPVESAYERYIKLTGCKFVQKVIPYETEDDLYLMLINEKPHVRFLGEDYRSKPYTGKNIEGIAIHFIDRKHGFSSSGLRARIRGEHLPKPTPIFENATHV
jgi:glycerol-3-phosphate cytidylyltransferase